MTRLDERLSALATMSPAQLRGEWVQVIKTEPPAVGRTLLSLAVAHRLQEKALGGMPSAQARVLARLGAQFARTGDIGTDAAATLKTGSRLVRDWQGECHHVLICDDGYRYRDQHFRSLSEIARTITGARWSGPRFFGLMGRSKAGRGRG